MHNECKLYLETLKTICGCSQVYTWLWYCTTGFLWGGVSIWETEENPRSFYYSSMWIYKELRITGLVRKISEFGMVYVLHSNKAPCSFWTEPPLAMKHHCLLQAFSFSWFFFLPYSPLSLVSCWLAYLFSSVWLRWLDTRLEFSKQRFEGSESWNHFPTYQPIN